MMRFFSYMIWDPSRDMFDFDLPILDRPILWYGFFFAFGFFVGYLFLTYLLRRYYLFFTRIREEDIVSWPDLIKEISKEVRPASMAIFSKLSSSLQRWCKEWKVGNPIPQDKKELLLKAMQQVILDSSFVFPIKVIFNVKHRLLAFAAKKLDKDVFLSVEKKLQLQQEFFPMMATLDQQTTKISEQMIFYVIIGAICGSRLGDVLFYQDWTDILHHPISIIAVWQGGLASHGGAIGILAALWIFAKKRKVPFWTAVDFTVIPTAAAAVFIRIGNFFNQEILGMPTTLPWGILFLHPADGGPIVPRHPAQLYEALSYLLILAILLLFWRRRLPFQKRGELTGLFLVLTFFSRFLIEFLKVEQSVHISVGSILTMGQYLSIPFIFLGFWLLFREKLGFISKRLFKHSFPS